VGCGGLLRGFVVTVANAHVIEARREGESEGYSWAPGSGNAPQGVTVGDRVVVQHRSYPAPTTGMSFEPVVVSYVFGWKDESEDEAPSDD